MEYCNTLGCAFGRKPRTSGMNRITRFQTAAFLEVRWENTDSWEENILPLELRVAVMEGGAAIYFTQKVRTIAPF